MREFNFVTDGAPMNTDERRYDGITEKIIGCAYKVANTLGSGFLEKVYESALAYELRKAGLKVIRQTPLKVWYKDIIVGEYVADLVVENTIVVETKAISGLEPIHSAVCTNYLKATKLPLCLLINFGRRVDVKRIAGPSLSNPASVTIGAPSVTKTGT